MATFDYCPSVNSSVEENNNVLSSKYGEGYEQRIADGINSRKRTWQVSFTGTKAYTNEIRDFLRTANGVDSFDWTPPDGEAGKWVCKNWSKTYSAPNAHTIRATFEEVFE